MICLKPMILWNWHWNRIIKVAYKVNFCLATVQYIHLLAIQLKIKKNHENTLKNTAYFCKKKTGFPIRFIFIYLKVNNNIFLQTFFFSFLYGPFLFTFIQFDTISIHSRPTYRLFKDNKYRQPSMGMYVVLPEYVHICCTMCVCVG